MSDKVDWLNLPVALPGGGLVPHLSGRRRMQIVDTVFEMIGGTDRFAAWAEKNPGEFYTKIYAKGMSKPISIETSNDDSLEGLLARLDGGEHAKVVSPDDAGGLSSADLLNIIDQEG